MDDLMIREALFNSEAKETHSILFSFVSQNRHPELQWRLAEDPQSLLLTFDKFFKWLLVVVKNKLLILVALRKQPNPPKELPKEDIYDIEIFFEVFHYFAWNSDFFAVYVNAIMNVNPDSALDTDKLDMLDKSIGVPEGDNDAEEEDNPDMATEFATDDERHAVSLKNTPVLVHQYISQVRLITSNFQHLQLLKLEKRLNGERVKFRVLKYPRSDQSLKPWRDVITGLFTEKKIEKQVLKALRREAYEKPSLKPFRTDGPALRFSGRAHCEAVLGCLYTLANSTDDITWANIPPSLLGTIQNSYNFLAPSKRCCPVCATIIQLLSNLLTGSRTSPLQALNSHSIIFSCAFPPGLPPDIRSELLKKYREELRVNLLALVNKKKRGFDSSEQSELMSVDGIDGNLDEEKAAAIREAALGRLSILEGEAKRLAWEDSLMNISGEEANKRWLSMEDEVKVGLSPPPPGTKNQTNFKAPTLLQTN